MHQTNFGGHAIPNRSANEAMEASYDSRDDEIAYLRLKVDEISTSLDTMQKTILGLRDSISILQSNAATSPPSGHHHQPVSTSGNSADSVLVHHQLYQRPLNPNGRLYRQSPVLLPLMDEFSVPMPKLPEPTIIDHAPLVYTEALKEESFDTLSSASPSDPGSPDAAHFITDPTEPSHGPMHSFSASNGADINIDVFFVEPVGGKVN